MLWARILMAHAPLVLLAALPLEAGSARAAEPVGLTQEGPDAALVKARASYQRALGLVKVGKNEAALTLFEAALVPLVDAPNGSELLYNLVAVARVLKRWDKVLLYAQGLVALDGESADARAMESVIGLAKGRLALGGAAVELVITAPAEANVYVDKTPVARGPKRALWTTPGMHHLRVTQAGHTTVERDVTVAVGVPAMVDVVLEKIIVRGKLEVQGKPAEGVQVFVDDKLQGVTPLPPIELEAKRCLVRFEKPGYGTWTRYVVVLANANVVVSPVLEKVPSPP